MKKIILSVIVATAFLPVLAEAATVNLAPSALAVTVGEKVTLQVSINPQGQTAYTAEVALSYPSNILEATSFTFAPPWLPLSQPGYDVMESGSIVKTAGYPSGIETPTLFGSITFVPLKTGIASIAIGNASQILDSKNQNIFSGVSNVVNISVIVPVLTKTEAVITPSSAVISTSTATSTAATSTPLDSRVAAVAASHSSHLLYYILGLIILALAGLIVWKSSHKIS